MRGSMFRLGPRGDCEQQTEADGLLRLAISAEEAGSHRRSSQPGQVICCVSFMFLFYYIKLQCSLVQCRLVSDSKRTV